MSNAKTASEALWFQLLNADFLPLSEQTILKLESGLNEPGLKFARIIPIINSDAALAAMLLKRAAPQMTSPGFDVLEAVARLGKKGIRAVVATAPTLEFLAPETQKNYQQVLLQGAFALRQTMSLQSIYSNDVQNSTLTAALLSCLAELHLVGVRHPHLDALRAEAAARHVEPQVIAERILGGPLSKLNAQIHQQHFGDSHLTDALMTSQSATRQLLSLRLGYQLARELARGWRSRDFASVVYNSAKLLDADEATIFSQAKNVMLRLQAEGFALASETASDFIKADIKALRDHLNLLRELENDGGGNALNALDSLLGPAERTKPLLDPALNPAMAASRIEEEAELANIKAIDSEQEKALTGIAKKIGHQHNIDEVLRTITDAAFETLEFKRVTLALCNTQRTVVKSRFQLGKDTATWAKNFSFSVQKPDENLVAWCINLRKPMRVKIASFEPRELINDRFRMIINHAPECVLAPLFRDNKPVAVLYADHGIKSDTKISGEQYKAFARLIEDANKRLEKMKG
jgi:HD-like signal output (HDOD) protein